MLHPCKSPSCRSDFVVPFPPSPYALSFHDESILDSNVSGFWHLGPPCLASGTQVSDFSFLGSLADRLCARGRLAKPQKLSPFFPCGSVRSQCAADDPIRYQSGAFHCIAAEWRVANAKEVPASRPPF